mgnify:CR=1 FL=1
MLSATHPPRLGKRVPLDSFSLREKVAAGRMRVKSFNFSERDVKTKT